MNVTRGGAACLIAALGVAGPGATGVSDPGAFAHLSCTAFMVRHDSGVVTGKNLDWAVGLGAVFLNPAGVFKTAWVSPPDAPASWSSRFSSITFNQFGREFPLGGMNEAGLVVEEMSYWQARYPARDERPAVNELEWIQYQLDNFASVDEVLEAEPAIRIAPFLFGLHYLVTDAGGDAAVVEYLDGKATVYTGEDLPVVALANDTYRDLIRQLGEHVGFGGDRVPGPGPESPERFARAATRIKRLEAGPLFAPVDSAFALLDDVAQEDTQWSIVYDPAERAAHFRTLTERTVRTVQLPPEPRSCAEGALGFRIDGPSEGWEPWTLEDNERLLGEVFAALEETEDDLPAPERREAMARHASTQTCRGSVLRPDPSPRDRAALQHGSLPQPVLAPQDSAGSWPGFAPQQGRLPQRSPAPHDSPLSQ